MTDDWNRNRFSGEVMLGPSLSGSVSSGFMPVTIRYSRLFPALSSASLKYCSPMALVSEVILSISSS